MINEDDKIENKLNAKIMTLLDKIYTLEYKVNALIWCIGTYVVFYIIYKLI